MTEIKKAKGKQLRKVSLNDLMKIRDAFHKHPNKEALITDHSFGDHYIAMMPASINAIKSLIVESGLDAIDPVAQSFAECDTCPPWQTVIPVK